MYVRVILQLAAASPLILVSMLLCPVLGPAPAILAEDPKPAAVKFATADELSLAATYFGPRDALQAAPAALLVHGAGGSRIELDKLALRLQKAGFAALTIDLRGHGESATEASSWKALDETGRRDAWSAMTRDVQAGADFLFAQKGVQPGALSLIGLGEGCTLVARHARRDERVRDVVLLSPLAEQFGFSLPKDMSELGELPVLIGVGKDQDSEAKRISEAARRSTSAKSTIEIEVAKSETSLLLADNKFLSEVTRWMKLKALPESSAKLPASKPRR